MAELAYPKLPSPMSIFRPWQINSSRDNTNEEISNSSHSDIEYYKNVEEASTSKVTIVQNQENYLLSKLLEQNSLRFQPKLDVKSPIEFSKNYLPSLSESLVSSSTSCNEENLTSEVSEKSTRKSQKRKSEEFNEISYKRAKTEEVKPSIVIPTPSFPGASTSGIVQGIPPTGSPLHPVNPFLSTNPFGSYMPLLEPPIFVPVSEVERVCARRPRPKRFSCNECGAAFSNRGQLSGHCRIHTGERPYRCNQPGCGKKFTRNEELTRHRRIHSGLRPFACGICPKRFGRKDHLKKHLRTHTRHVIPHFTPLQPFEHLHNLQQVQHFQHLQHLQHLQQLQFQIPLMPFPIEKTL